MSSKNIRVGLHLSRQKLVESVDARMISLMRLILASSALFVIYIDPSEPDRLVQQTYAALISYLVYSLSLYAFSLSRPLKSRWLSPWIPWLDVCWFILLIALSSGTNSIFFFFFFFAILISSFIWGFTSGLRLTIASAVLFTLVGYLTAPEAPHFQLNRFLLRPIYLLVLGYMIAYWGGYEIRLKEGLKFLRDINTFSNPRFGIDHTVNWMMERIRSFYDADSVLLILSSAKPTDYTLRRVSREKAYAKSSGEIVGRDVARIFLSVPANEALVYRGSRLANLTYNISTGEVCRDERRHEALVSALESNRFLAVPLNHQAREIGRCYIVGGRTRYNSTDVDFVLQAVGQVLPVIDNIRLVDRLASHAADREREKIARDIHDSVIQPYIGFQMGLAAIAQKIERGDGEVAARVKELSDLTVKGIADLRHYIRGIKGAEGDENPVLLPSLRRFASKFSEATGIGVQVEASETIAINDRLAGEVFQLIIEGFSNIRRHTNSATAKAALNQVDGKLILRIENDNSKDAKVLFHPRSLAERTAALGGNLTVENASDRNTVVKIEIPL